jgi:3-oxoacyl-[acyl-carrier-protein] synthase-3
MSDLALPRTATGLGERDALRTATVLGLGHAVPARVVTNHSIAERLGIEPSWIVKRTGIQSRRHAEAEERLVDYAVAAARRALGEAGTDPVDLDLIIVATMSPDEVTPGTAPLVAAALGANGTGALDVNAACSGFISGVSMATGLIESRRAERVLVVGADILSRLTDFDDRKTAALFGDGAGAVVLGPGDGVKGIGPVVLRADGTLAPAIVADHGDRLIRMDGHTTFQAAIKVLTESTLEACARSGVSLDDIDLFVYHQANGRIISAVAERLDLPSAKVADYVAEMGNTSAASIPLTLSLAREDGRLRAGDRVLVGAVGAGFAWGAAVIDWELG